MVVESIKNRYKILIIVLIAFFIYWPGIPLISLSCHQIKDDGVCFDIAQLRISMYGSDGIWNDANPYSNECWVQDNDGEIKPCVMDMDELSIPFSLWPEQNCDEICQESNANHREMMEISLISYGYQWTLKVLLIIIILIVIFIGIVFGVKSWRKRKQKLDF